MTHPGIESRTEGVLVARPACPGGHQGVVSPDAPNAVQRRSCQHPLLRAQPTSNNEMLAGIPLHCSNATTTMPPAEQRRPISARLDLIAVESCRFNDY
jgi:hypothetical protein